MRTYLVIILVCGLLLAGCGDKETSTESTPAQPTKTTVVEQIEQSADNVTKQVTEMVETGTKLVKDTAADAKLAVKEVVATATENVTAVAKVAKQKTTDIVDKSKEEIIEVKEQLKQKGTELLDNQQKSSVTNENQSNNILSSVAAVTSTVVSSASHTSKVSGKIQASEFLVFESKNGNVTLPHAEHGKLYGCSACHGDVTPGAFELGKETAHKICKDCHKEQGGPIKCSGCHKK